MPAITAAPSSTASSGLTRASWRTAAVRAMTPQVKGARSWRQYRARFVTRERIDGGGVGGGAWQVKRCLGVVAVGGRRSDRSDHAAL
jgi:hypothetical protein